MRTVPAAHCWTSRHDTTRYDTAQHNWRSNLYWLLPLAQSWLLAACARERFWLLKYTTRHNMTKTRNDTQHDTTRHDTTRQDTTHATIHINLYLCPSCGCQQFVPDNSSDFWKTRYDMIRHNTNLRDTTVHHTTQLKRTNRREQVPKASKSHTLWRDKSSSPFGFLHTQLLRQKTAILRWIVDNTSY